MKKPTFKRFALVTGSSSGIGKEIALKLSKNGYIVFINFREDEIGANTVKNTIKKNGGESYIVKADITKDTEVKNLFSEISKISKTLDVVINNSGIYVPEYIEQHSIKTWDSIINTNLRGKLLCTKYSIPFLKKSSNPIIINIATRAGTSAMEESSAYCCAASGIIMLTKVSALELSKYSIRVNTISPGLTKTKLTLAYDTEEDFNCYAKNNPSKRIGTSEDIANTILFLISKEGSYINGENINVSGGILLK